MVSHFNLKTERWEQLTPKQSVERMTAEGIGVCFPIHEWPAKQKVYAPLLEACGYKRFIKATMPTFYPAGHSLITGIHSDKDFPIFRRSPAIRPPQ